jgi:hypothetical protein
MTQLASILDRSTFNAALESATAGSNQKRIANTHDRFGTEIYNPVSMISRASLVRGHVAIEAVDACRDEAASDRL